ncbi:unnamed protein product [Larinioides sclopetarius]|uniref:Histone chaperone domain-containing protein n=1 Tax=Larinioides sclopetarius TaxID=280406 RepID=A0AAV2A5M0_9ARAC
MESATKPSMLEILNECLKDSNLETVSKAELRKKYLEKIGLSKLPHEDKNLFTSAVNTAYLNYIANKTTTDDKTKVDESSDVEIKESSEDWKLVMSSSSDDDITPGNITENVINNHFTNGENDIQKTSNNEIKENSEHEMLKVDSSLGDNTSSGNIQENVEDQFVNGVYDIEMESSCDFDERPLASHKNKSIKKSLLAPTLSSFKRQRVKRTLTSSSDDETIQLKPTKRNKVLKARKSSYFEDQPIAKSEGEKKVPRSVKNQNSFKKTVIESSDSEDEPLSLFQKKSNSLSRSVNPLTESEESENENLSKFMKKRFSNPVNSEDESIMSSAKKNTKFVDDSKNHSSNSEDEPLISLKISNNSNSNGEQMKFKAKLKSNGSQDLMKLKDNSSHSEDESLIEYRKYNDAMHLDKKKISKRKLNSSSKFSKLFESTSGSEDESLAKDFKKKKDNFIHSNDSENEPLKNFNKKKIDNSNDSKKKQSDKTIKQKEKPSLKKHLSNNKEQTVKEKRYVDSDDDSNMSNQKEEKFFNGLNSLLSDSSADVPLSNLKKGTNNFNDSENEGSLLNQKKEKSFNEKKSFLLSDSSEDEPLSNLKKETNSSSDSENEALIKLSYKSDRKQQNSGSASSSFVDENEEQSSKKNKLPKRKETDSKKGKKHPSASENKIEHLKKYLRVAGIRISNYNKLFENCKTMKAKCEKMMSLLEKEGLKGRPTLEKCKKLRKKIETKREIAELDVSNILKEGGGRPKRSVCSDTTNCKQSEEKSTPIKKFSRLQDIVDSEESE